MILFDTSHTPAYLSSGSRSLQDEVEAIDIPWEWTDLDSFDRDPVNRLLCRALLVVEILAFAAFFLTAGYSLAVFVRNNWQLPNLWILMPLALIIWAFASSLRAREKDWHHEAAVENFMSWAWDTHGVALLPQEAVELYDGARIYHASARQRNYGEVQKRIEGELVTLALLSDERGRFLAKRSDTGVYEPLPIRVEAHPHVQ